MIQTDRIPPAAGTLLRELIDNHNIKITCAYDEIYRRETDEYAVLDISGTADGFLVHICCSEEKSAFYAICEIDRRIKSGTLQMGTFTVSPSFAVRGYIEGFYGKPWTQAQRISVMELAAKYRMNTVFYAPKDDPYHREHWRELYPEDRLMQLKALSDRAQTLYMDFYWCVAPGLSIRYSDPRDFTALCNKAKQVFELGVRCFGLLLDDIDETLRDSGDKRIYNDLVSAHVDLINRFFAFLTELEPAAKLTVCPTVYHGTGNEPYITKLGKGIPGEVGLFWTGPDICSRALTSEDAARFAMCTGHKPLYWDNYPVNDEAMFREMHLGPVIGRDGDLAEYATGLIANCMEYAECSKIPLCTIADYLLYGERYDPEASFENAVREAVGDANTKAFLTFADHLYTSCLMNTNDRRLTETFYQAGKAVSENNTEQANKIINAYTERMEKSLTFLNNDFPI